ncbi:MAG: 50S ribosomal protein L13 [Dethiobacteria bacterium]|jgi:large subunit ribosomal protein L13
MAKKEGIEQQWHLIDASGLPLGRLASEVARLLRGKHRPTYTPHVDMGDYIVVINASKIVLTGKKAEQKFYYRHTGYPGGLKKIRYDDLMQRWPERAVYLAVKRMLPSNRLGRAMMRKLKIYAGSQHPHEAQKPVLWDYRPKRVVEN